MPFAPWLAEPSHIRQVFIPKGASWLNLQEAWWRIFRRYAVAGQHFATVAEITLATQVATAQLNTRARRGYGAAQPRNPGSDGAPSHTESEKGRSKRVRRRP